MPGISVPEVPADRRHVFYNYVIRFRPEQLWLDVPPRWLRERVQRALIAEGVPDYPNAVAFLDAHCYLFDTDYRNDKRLVDLYAEALSKVLGNLDELGEPDLEAEDRMFAARYPWEVVERSDR